MSTHKYLFSRLILGMLILAQLVTISIPANAATAAPQASSCGNALLQAAAAPTVVHAPDEPVKIPKEKVDAAAFQAVWYDRTNDKSAVYVLIQVLLARAYGNSGDEEARTEALTKLVERFNRQIPSAELNNHTYDEVIHTTLDSALQIPELAHLVPGVWEQMNDKKAYARFETDSTTNVIQSVQQYDLGERLLALAPEIVYQVHDCAQKNAGFADLFDLFNLERLGVSIRADAKTILANDTDLMPPEIGDNIAADGSLTISPNQLKQLGQGELAALNQTIDEMQGTLKEIDQEQKVITAYLENAERRAIWQERMKKKAEAYKLKVEAAQAGIAIVTTIAGQIDPKFAKDFSVVATSSLQVADSMHKWLEATAGLGALDKVFSLSTVVMTGNLLGAVMNVVSLFGDDKPSPEQMILAEIGKLRQQINELRVEMHERFDRIDQSLNAIYTTMNDRFNLIDLQLGKLNGNLQEVQQALAELDLKLSRIERNNFEFLNALGRRPLLDAINGGLGYLERTGQPMPYQPDFVGFENTLHSWATIHAFDPLNAGPTQRDYSDAQMLSELNTYPVDANINYINGWLVAHGMPAIANKRLPSPRDWLFASRAYTQLALEWTDHMARIDPKRGEALSKIGEELEAAMRNLSTRQTVSRTLGNQLLFSSVITNYQSKVDALDSAIEIVENGYMNEVRIGRLGREEPFAVHGGAYQPLTYRAPGVVRADDHFRGEKGVLPLPSQFSDHIPGFAAYNLAEYLKLGTFRTAVGEEWFNVTRVCDATECYDVGDLKLVLFVYFDETFVMQQTLPMGRMRVEENWLRTYWGPFNCAEKFATIALPDPLSPAEEAEVQKLFAATVKKVETQLSGYEQELYGRILSEMNSGSLKAPVAEVDGSKALLDTVIALGLPRAASNDEFLHGILYGDQQLVDEKPLIQSYVSRMAQPLEGGSLLNNPRFLLATTADERRSALQGIVNQYLAAISTEEYVEEADYIAATRRALDLTLRIVEIESSTPGAASKQIFLPLVQR